MDQELLHIINNFETEGTTFVSGKRNKIKLFSYHNLTISIKSFKIPIFINGVVYRFFRKSKAKRSFLYAKKLESLQIGTPKPIAYFENKTAIRLLESYYICEHLHVDYVFKDLFNTDIDDLEKILKQFAHFCFKLHENGIEFLDHSPGNTLIKKNNSGNYDFYLVDLNRMKFHKSMDIGLRIKNMSRLTPNEYMIQTIAFEYAKLIHENETEIFTLLWNSTNAFYQKFDKKKELKKKLNIKK